MECIQCRTALRPGARFCNVCGARQPRPEPTDATSQDLDVGAEASAEGVSGGGALEGYDADEGARVKRPARIPRATDESDAAEATPAAEHAVATNLLPEDPMEEQTARAQEGALGPTEGGDGLPDAVGHDGVSQEQPAPQEAAEDSGMPPLAGLSRSAPEPPTSGADTPSDGLPWPLPVHMIVGGRYRIESIADTSPDGPGAENSYLVTDLQGYERCWSCGTQYGMSAASDQFCRECGADMLAREYVMRERRLAPGESAHDTEPAQAAPADAAQQTGSEDEASATDMADAADAMGAAAIESAQASDAEVVPAASAAHAEQGAVREFTQGARAYHVEPYSPEPPPFPHGVRVLAAAASDTGQARAAHGNEDSVGVLVLNAIHGSIAQPLALGVVADGLGGHVSGQVASRLVVRALSDHVLRSAALPLVDIDASETPPDEVVRQVLVEGTQVANAAVYAANQSSGGDMGSTIVAAMICGDTAYIANAGDSRAYVLDGDTLRRVTTDHSLVEQLIASGLIAPEERYTHPKRNQIFRSLGDEPAAQVDIFIQKLRPGMRLLLCSDGLWEMVRDDELAAILRECANPREACDTFVRRANEQGGEDNISALVIEVNA
jgi:serine/threonine protein phosphatase PrpC